MYPLEGVEMGRPSKPLISRDTVVRASLHIIDEEGLEAFSLPRLARELHVRAPSLYNHFADKDEILSLVGRHVLGALVRPRRPPGDDWPEYFVLLAVNFRTAVLRHRNAAPILLRHLPRDVFATGLEDAARHLTASGVPVELHALILDGVEMLSLGAVLVEATRTPPCRHVFAASRFDHDSHPSVAAAVANNGFTVKSLFAERIRCFLYGVTRAPHDGALDENLDHRPISC